MTDSIDLTVNIAGIKMQNPVMVASAPLALVMSKSFYDINKLGAIVTKALLCPQGNPTKNS